MRIYWRPRKSPFGVSMPWWLGLPVFMVWGVAVLGIYVVIGTAWLLWFVGHGVTRLLTRADERATADGRAYTGIGTSESAPAMAPLPPRRMLLPPDSMNQEVPEWLGNLRSRYQVELDATSSLPDQMSRLQAEVDIRKRFGAAMDASIEIWMASASPESLARYEPLIRAQRARAGSSKVLGDSGIT